MSNRDFAGSGLIFSGKTGKENTVKSISKSLPNEPPQHKVL